MRALERGGAGAAHLDVKRFQRAVGIDLVGERGSRRAAQLASHGPGGVAARGFGRALT